MNEIIAYGKQSVSEADIEAVEKILRSDYLTQGPTVPAFERAVASKCNSQFAVAVNSATSALHIACLALGVSSGDTVWTCSNTFVASANCALYCGASIDFVDIEHDTWCLSPKKLKQKLETHQSLGKPLPKVVIPVHLTGQSCDMREIYKLGQDFGFGIIEDASHAIGGRYIDNPVGNCRYSDITVFSFHPVKIITSGEGGMALTNDPKLFERMSRLRIHGIVNDPKKMQKEIAEPWYYEQVDLGFNYRMTDIHAALGLSQLNKVDNFVKKRNELAERYEKLIKNLPLKTQFVPKNVFSARHLFVTRASQDLHLKLFNRLRNAGIIVHLHYMPVYLHPFYQKLGFQKGYNPEAEEYAKEAITLPLYPTLSFKQQDRVISILESELG